MTAEYKKLVQSLEQGSFAPVYLIDGEEPFYLDRITAYFEERILSPEERDFNLMVLYGKDATWADVVNACRRFPMFAERQVVILKEAAQLRDLGELAGYVEHPAPTTVFLIEHRFKKADGRSRLVSQVKKKGVYFTSDKIKDEQLPAWIQAYGDSIGLKIGEKESEILASFLGTDLQKIANEIEKVRINIPGEKELTAKHIQTFIGISREYNIFEFPEALTSGDKDRLYRMLSYFTANRKSAPMPLVIGSFYAHFNRIYQACAYHGRPAKEASAALHLYGERLQGVMSAVQRYGPQKIEHCLLLLGRYSTYSVGIGNSSADDDELLKEMIGRMELVLS